MLVLFIKENKTKIIIVTAILVVTVISIGLALYYLLPKENTTTTNVPTTPPQTSPTRTYPESKSL